MKHVAVLVQSHWLCPVSVQGLGTATATRIMGTIGVGSSPCSGVLHKTIQSIRPFVKDLEVLVKWMSEFQNSLVYKWIYSSTTFILFVKTFMKKLIMYIYINCKVWNIQWFKTKFYWETIMLSEARLKNHPQEFVHVCVDKWFLKSTCPHSF